MDNWEKLKTEIAIETKAYFAGKKIDINELVDLLQKVLMARIDEEYKLNGVAVSIPKAMYDILDDDTTKKQRTLNFSILCKFEPFLRKMLFLLDLPKFQKIVDDKKGLAAIVKALNLNPNRIDYDNEEENKNREYTEYDYHLFKVYNLRNTESHDMELWGSRELAENIESIFIFYLEVLNIHKTALNEILLSQQNDFNEYISSVMAEFESNSKRFISTESIEDFSMFESYAVEHKNNVTEEDIEQERTGTVDYIRKNRLPEKRMLLWGDAGMGKSTTLQYLAYIDAKDYKMGSSNIVPVYVPLGMLIVKDETLEQYICKKIGVEYLTGVELFKKGKISLFLDGINEIPADNGAGIQASRLKEVQNLLDAYPKMLILVSNRPDSYNFFKEIPVFRLQKMDMKKIQEFLQKNTDSDRIRNVILEGIKQNHRLLQLVGTPLMATRLIEIVKDLKELPQSEGTIIKKFLESLYKRERYDKKDTRFDEFKINNLLIYLAAYGFQKNGTNSGLSNIEVLQCFSDCMDKLHFSYDSTYALDVLLNLGVLSSDKKKEVIVFSHQAYQDYYVSCAEKIGNVVTSRPDSKLDILRETKEDNSLIERSSYLEKADLIEVGNKNTSGLVKETSGEGIEIDDKVSFYQKYANDEKHEKSIIYRLHTMDRLARNMEIELLAQYNLLLAAKVISSGEPDQEIEEFVIKKALDNIRSTVDEDVRFESILVFLELDRTLELKDNISSLVYKGEQGTKILSSVAMKLSGDQCIVFLDALRQQEHSKKLSSALSTVINIFRLKDYEYSWTPENMHVIEDIANGINSILKSSPYNLLSFYSSFNVPKEFLTEDISKVLEKVVVKHIDIVADFVERYDLVFDMSPQRMITLELHSGSSKAHKNAYLQIASLPSEEKIEIVKSYLPSAKHMRSAVYHQLQDSDQFEISRRWNVYYYERRRKRIPHFLTPQEAHYIVFDLGMIIQYGQDAIYSPKNNKKYTKLSFAESLRSARKELEGKGDEEVLAAATLDDFISFKNEFENIIRNRIKMKKDEMNKKRKENELSKKMMNNDT